jgi:hypothetical protein
MGVRRPRGGHVTSVIALDIHVARRAGGETIFAVKENVERATVDQLKLGDGRIE